MKQKKYLNFIEIIAVQELIDLQIFQINVKDEKFEASNPQEYWQSDKDEDKSNIIKKEKMRELGFI